MLKIVKIEDLSSYQLVKERGKANIIIENAIIYSQKL